MNTILSNQDRARLVLIVFYVNILLILVFAGAEWWQANLIESADLNTETAEQSDLIVGLAAFGFIGGMIASAVVFILWFRRAYANLERLENPQSILRYSEGWAAGAWFIPFMNLVRPYTIMKEIWNGTQTNIPGKMEREGLKDASLVGWWWAAWITYNIISNVTSRMGGDQQIEDIAFGLRAGAIGSLLAIPAALLAIRMVQQTSIFEQELYESQHVSDPLDHLLT